jgi:gamma-glutamyl hercynylcysteine S-oxide synthase
MFDDSGLASAIRRADAGTLARALAASRQETLATFEVYEAAQALRVPLSPGMNLPLWELGHIGWFQEFWIARNPQRTQGSAADPLAPRGAGVREDADALYDSSRVAHASRWQLLLPDSQATRADLLQQLERSLALLAQADADDDALYFYRLVLLHEDMHHEAAVYMAHTLGIAEAVGRWRQPAESGARHELALPAARFAVGHLGGGFAFDNELGAHEIELPACAIDSRPVTWQEFMPFVEAGGYRDPRWWGEAGQRWLASAEPPQPAQAPDRAACHLSFYEAQAWCAWAGRRLPTEAEWERAALERPLDFRWGHVWEWTASAFMPYPGFVAHPYRDYSAPWFDGRPVLRGASFATAARLKHPRYRNYFLPERRDIFAGFRSCSR